MGSRLKNKVAVVTGGGSGIGEAIARAFADEGCRVVISGRRAAQIEKVAEEIAGTAIVADVSVEKDVAALMTAAAGSDGTIDILINNAGITGPVANAEDLDMLAWDETVAINLRGVILCIKHAAPFLKVQGGSIINMSSLMGLRGYPMRSAYSATKFAVIGITQAIAHELGPHGVRVNALCPGAVNGELMTRVIAARAAAEARSEEEIIRANYTDVAAMRKWVEPEEVAATAVFLASEAASSITAESIKVDAGRM